MQGTAIVPGCIAGWGGIGLPSGPIIPGAITAPTGTFGGAIGTGGFFGCFSGSGSCSWDQARRIVSLRRSKVICIRAVSRGFGGGCVAGPGVVGVALAAAAPTLGTRAGPIANQRPGGIVAKGQTGLGNATIAGGAATVCACASLPAANTATKANAKREAIGDGL